MVKPKVALPKASSFNEIVTLDIKQFGDKYVLWCIDAFTRFVQGKLLVLVTWNNWKHIHD